MAYKKHGELYAVLAVDLGTRHQAALSELRPLPDLAKSLPACAIQVTSVGDPSGSACFSHKGVERTENKILTKYLSLKQV